MIFFQKVFSKYEMDFGLFETGLVKKIIFYICNQSDFLWAFKFSPFDFVSFSPDNGCVSPHSRVKIESTLETDEQFPINVRENSKSLSYLLICISVIL